MKRAGASAPSRPKVNCELNRTGRAKKERLSLSQAARNHKERERTEPGGVCCMAIKLGALGDKMRLAEESRLPKMRARSRKTRAPPCNEVLREIKKRQEILRLAVCVCGCGDPSECIRCSPPASPLREHSTNKAFLLSFQ